eukprot:TRINITY_DN228_c2_g1_i2.p1 TRINITY_DN228_c2_g1~~TRINITY_DN228_c2_g1_i2.p1  ORF type:complete len:271 (+),score=17.58 TRINITY_DN228_c2_g1_i2:10-822(+)
MEEVSEELLALVFSFVPVGKHLYHCLLVSHLWHKAVCSEVIWQQRCLAEGVTTCPPHYTWKQLYQYDCTLKWDPATVTQSSEVRTLPTVTNHTVRSNSNFIYLSVRTNYSIKKSISDIYCVRFRVDKRGGADHNAFGIGFATSYWNPVKFSLDCSTYPDKELSYCYWTHRDGTFWDVSARTKLSTIVCTKGQVVGEGDVLTTVVNFAKGHIHFYSPGTVDARLALAPWVTELWPVATLYCATDTVTLMPDRSIPPQYDPDRLEWQGADIQ